MLLLFIGITFLLFLAPLMPALLEWWFPSDNAPLKIVQEYDGDIRHFANGFRRYIDTNFADSFADGAREGTAKDNTRFQVVGEDGRPVLASDEFSRKTTNKLILSRAPLILPDHMFFETELYSSASIVSGENDQFRALLADGDIHLKQNCTVVRWVHSNAVLMAGENCRLYGRASAEKAMSLSQGCSFMRIHSARILFGTTQPTAISYLEPKDLTELNDLPDVRDQSGRRWLLHKNVTIPAKHYFDGDIVAGGNIVIEDGAYIRGSIKSNGHCTIGKNVVIDGSIVSAGDLTIGAGSRIKGPVITEHYLYVETGTTIGSEAVPTSVNAAHATFETQVVVYGSVWLGKSGDVVAPKAVSYQEAA